MTVLHANDHVFDALLKEHDRVVVDFTAVWCGPCKRMAPVFEQVGSIDDSLNFVVTSIDDPHLSQMAKEHKTVKFIKVDVDESRQTAAKCQVTAMPTFQAFFKGQMVDMFMGASEHNLKTLVTRVEKFVPGDPVRAEVNEFRRCFNNSPRSRLRRNFAAGKKNVLCCVFCDFLAQSNRRAPSASPLRFWIIAALLLYIIYRVAFKQ